MGEDIAPMIAYMHEQWQYGDIIYVYYSSTVPFKYYLSRYPFAEGSYVFSTKSRKEWENYLPVLNDLAENYERVWLIFSHVHATGTDTEEAFLLAHLDEIGGE